MTTAATCWLDDEQAAAATLNAHAGSGVPTFAGFDFYGWFVDGQPFSPPEVADDERPVFCMVRSGQAFPVPCLNGGFSAPPREGTLILELYVGRRMEQGISRAVWDAAIEALSDHLPAGIGIHVQEWRPPSPGDVTAPRFANFVSEAVTVPYASTSTATAA